MDKINYIPDMKPKLKPITSYDTSLFNILRQDSRKDFDYPWHYHPEFEITFILSSCGIRYVGNSIENYDDDDLVLLGPQLPHCWIACNEETRPVTAITVYMDQHILNNDIFRTQEFDLIRKMLARAEKGIKFNKAVAMDLKDRFLKLSSLPPFQRMMLFFEILNELSIVQEYEILSNHSFTYELNTSNNTRINIICDYIQKNYRNQITLAEAAAQVHMSKEYFSRYFSKVMKKTFFEYCNEYKINRACRLLIESDKQVSEICYEAGFESIPFFYRQFSKFKKCTPRDFKLNYEKAASI